MKKEYFKPLLTVFGTLTELTNTRIAAYKLWKWRKRRQQKSKRLVACTSGRRTLDK